MASTFETLRRHRFALMTTRRRNGEPVATPVWVVVGGDSAYVVSRGPGKVKRIRNDPWVELTPCTARGRAKGAPASGTARALGTTIPPDVRRLFLRKYGPVGALALLGARLKRDKPVLIEISAGAA